MAPREAPLPVPLVNTCSMPGGRAAGRRGELVVGDVDDPGALADRQPGQRHHVAGIELALGVRGAQASATAAARQAAARLATRRTPASQRGTVRKCTIASLPEPKQTPAGI